MDLGDRQVEDVGDDGQVGLVDVTEFFLHRMEDRHQSTAQTAQLGRDRTHTVGTPGNRDGGGWHDLCRHNNDCPGLLVGGQSKLTYDVIARFYQLVSCGARDGQ